MQQQIFGRTIFTIAQICKTGLINLVVILKAKVSGKKIIKTKNCRRVAHLQKTFYLVDQEIYTAAFGIVKAMFKFV